MKNQILTIASLSLISCDSAPTKDKLYYKYYELGLNGTDTIKVVDGNGMKQGL